jgi:hypothetical protein
MTNCQKCGNGVSRVKTHRLDAATVRVYYFCPECNLMTEEVKAERFIGEKTHIYTMDNRGTEVRHPDFGKCDKCKKPHILVDIIRLDPEHVRYRYKCDIDGCPYGGDYKYYDSRRYIEEGEVVMSLPPPKRKRRYRRSKKTAIKYV